MAIKRCGFGLEAWNPDTQENPWSNGIFLVLTQRDVHYTSSCARGVTLTACQSSPR